MEQSKGKSSCQRGVILTSIGYRKLHRAKVNWEIEQNTRCTLDILSQQTGLTANTLSKIFGRSVAVDKRSLWVCFSAFNLDLDGQDYLSSSTLAYKDCQFSHWGINVNF
ncbi:hypothetical protein [Microcystis aeruginosa]|uniref:hypothetical protein n=1 Tax=Microcystis aeruginosa TaxID=1126 RepID=UPI00188017F5|nr:hypothetical protein [Microcystis aeruginosa]MBE8996608.1 hypothetical protein [Microcystis aeruginosa LEGE 91341]